MKLLRATFENFRLLRDLDLDFSRDPNSKLTVIRAANESGKTTILHALQWALYGDSALPDKGKGFRLHPIDWNASGHSRVPITATVEFELTTHRRVNGKLSETRRHYRLVRSVIEDVNSLSSRPASTLKLFLLDSSGSKPVPEPEALINDELPPELREVFFTDGDRALSFIEADVALSTKRERVQRAIRSLLGLGVIKDAIKHVRKAEVVVNRKAKQVGGGNELNQIASKLETIENDRQELVAALKDAKQQFEAFNIRVDQIDREIAMALQKGDREQLRKDLDRTKHEIGQINQQLSSARKEHSTLFRSRSIAADLLTATLERALKRLDTLRDQGKIPNTTIPVLEDRLSAAVCICGETLDAGDPGGRKRRSHIEKLIVTSRRADEIQGIITDLYFRAKPLLSGAVGSSDKWLDKYKQVVEKRDRLRTERDELGRRFRALEMQVDALPDTDIRGLRQTRLRYLSQRDRYLYQQSANETKLDALKRSRTELETRRDRLLREQKKGRLVLAELEVTQDVLRILRSAYERITNEELHKVSELMNKIFLEMIGADPQQGAIIRRATVSPKFDIIVYGPNDRNLNPDRDLNGASRRALTLAFILSLTKVSEVKAPNVIDTPLGMTSGFVRRSILRTTVRESAQPILFLTHDEIAGCEEIIDGAAGSVYTLTNPAHYPKMLVNDPKVVERKVLRCECGHRQECHLCRRHVDARPRVKVAS